MADDWAVTNKATGEVQFVKVEGGRHPSGCGYPVKKFTAHKLDRAPHEDDNYDGKALTRCPVKAARRERAAKLAVLRPHERLDEIERMIDAKLRAYGLIRGEPNDG